MLASLSIECDFLEQQSAEDPVDRQTWAAVVIRVAGRIESRVWDRGAGSERNNLYVPAFPLARWLVANWWQVLYEPTTEGIPSSDWIRRHCIRSADSGLLLPHLRLFSTGPGLLARWIADEQDAYPLMPVNFTSSDSIQLDRVEAEQGLRRFIVEVLVGSATSIRQRSRKS